MDDEKFVVEVIMTVRTDPYAYEKLGSRNFRVEGPYETLAFLEIGMSMDRLYAELMHLVFESLTDEETEGE